jgi:hypothetical protein
MESMLILLKFSSFICINSRLRMSARFDLGGGLAAERGLANRPLLVKVISISGVGLD